MDHERSLNPTASKTEAPPKSLLQVLALPISVLFLLVPGLLLFVEHVRTGSKLIEGTNWSEQTMSGTVDRPQAVMGVAGSNPFHPAVVAEENAVEVARCEGWRDWVDYGSGWKGCMP